MFLFPGALDELATSIVTLLPREMTLHEQRHFPSDLPLFRAACRV